MAGPNKYTDYLEKQNNRYRVQSKEDRKEKIKDKIKNKPEQAKSNK